MRQKDTEHSLPNAIRLEMAILGTSLMDRAVMDLAAEKLNDEDIFSQRCRDLFRIMCNMADKGKAIDLISVGTALQLMGREDLNDLLMDVAENICTYGTAESYLKEISDAAVKRRMLGVAQKIEASVYTEEDVESVVESCEHALFSAVERKEESKESNATQMLSSVFDAMNKTSKGEAVGVSTCYTELDTLIGGFEKGNLSLIGGRPSQGKTAFQLSMIYRQAVIHKIPVVLFTLEMSRTQIGQRFISIGSGVNLFKLRNTMLTRDEYALINEVSAKIADSPLLVDDGAQLSANRFRSTLRRMIRQYGVVVAYIDHVHIMSHKDRDDRQGITNISRSLKATARELDIPVVALAQLSRKSAERSKKDRRPTLADLRESGSLEQDADLVMLVHREFYYTKKEEDKFDAEVIVAKQRNGPTDTLNFHWEPSCAAFKEMEGSENGDAGW